MAKSLSAAGRRAGFLSVSAFAIRASWHVWGTLPDQVQRIHNTEQETIHTANHGRALAGGRQRTIRVHAGGTREQPCTLYWSQVDAPQPHEPWGHRTLARAWRGHGAGVARTIGHFVVWVARAWRGHGAGVARACPVTPGNTGVASQRCKRGVHQPGVEREP
eukprot:gene24552-biopygen5942